MTFIVQFVVQIKNCVKKTHGIFTKYIHILFKFLNTNMF